ncbi:MAG TPA: FlgD immunoglobulin-like domain containing protein, partial [Dokdonella sp.]
MGRYATEGDAPPTPSLPQLVLPGDGSRLADMACDPSFSVAGVERRVYDPATNRFFLAAGETVAWEYYPEGWALAHEIGIHDYFSIDVDDNHADVLLAGTLIPLIESADVARHPLRVRCEGAPAADWPEVILRDGARIRADGRIQTMSRGLSAAAWLPENRLNAIWPDDSRALLSGNRAIASLLNLGAMLRARTLGRGIELSGVAADRNFAYYQLDWAPVEQPNAWQALIPASNDEVFLDEFLTWVPPQPGVFRLRLTVADKAGNATSTFATASSFDSAQIDNFSLAPRYFSPNGDGIQDHATAGYRVRQPVTLSIRVSNAQGATVLALERTYSTNQLGVDEFAWDGRAANGELVPDGRYRVELGGFGAWVVVDNRVPRAAGRVGEPYRACSSEDCLGTIIVGPEVHASASDENLETWRFETKPLGSGSWVQTATAHPLLPGEYASREFRVVASDKAGNRAAVHMGVAEDILILQAVGRPGSINPANRFDPMPGGTFSYHSPPFTSPPDPDSRHRVVVDQSASTDILFGWNYSRPFALVAVETSSEDSPGDWIERGSLAGDAIHCGELQCGRGPLTFPLDASSLPLGSRHLVRLRGERGDGSRVYSNQGSLQVGGLNAPSCHWLDDVYFVTADEYFDGPLASATLHYLGTNGEEFRVPASTIEEHLVRFDLPPIQTSNAWVEAIDRRGFHRVSPQGALVCDAAPDHVDRFRTTFGPFPVVQDRCDGVPSDRVGLFLRVQRDVTAHEPFPRHARISHVHGVTGAEVVLFDGDIQSTIIREPLELQIPTGLWPEAEYEARAEIDFVDGSSTIRTTRIPVVKQAPAIDLELPRNGERVCATGGPPVQTLAFVASINSTGSSDYRIGMGSGNHPDQFSCFPGNRNVNGPMSCASYEAMRVLDGQSVPGEGGFLQADLTHLDGVATLQMKGVNWSGGTVCTERSFILDSALGLTERSLPQTLLPYSVAGTHAVGISPTGDPRFAAGKFALRATEPLQATATLHQASRNAMGDLVVDSFVLDTLMQADAEAGDLDVAWNGMLGGSTAPDGLYGIVISAADDCGFEKSFQYGVLVDSTPPAVDISSPGESSVIASPIVQIAGTAFDNVHLRSWSLDVALAESPDAWQNIASGELAIASPQVLANWSRGSLTGAVDLRLSAIDYLGNRAEAHSPLTLGEPAALIGAAAVQPALLSPNADGVLDAARIELGLLRPAAVDARVTDAAGTAVASLHSGYLGAGTSSWVWTGLAGPTQTVPDGSYQVRIDAADPQGVAAPEAVVLAATVDATPPSLEIVQPAGDFAATSSVIELRLVDLHFAGFEARVVRVSDGVEVLSTGGTQAGNVMITSLAGFSEGEYRLHAEARDAAGNRSVRDVTFQVDSTRPTVTLDSPPEGALVPAVSATVVAGSVNDPNLAEWTLEVAGEADLDWAELVRGDANPTGNELMSWTPGLPDDRYRLRLRAVDRAGNEQQVEHAIVL